MSTTARCIPVTLAAILAAGAWCSARAAAPAAGQTSSQEKALAQRAKELAETRLRELGRGYTAEIDSARHVVYVSAVDKHNLQHVAGLLAAHCDAQQKLLFPSALQWNVTVILPTLRDYRKLAPMAKALGYYHVESRTLCSISFSDVLLHEFIHALHHNDMALAGQRHPIWLTEALATLFQGSRLRDAKLEVLPCQSLRDLQAALAKGEVPALADLLAMSPKQFLAKAKVCYPQVRYLAMYLYRQGKLAEYYRAYKADYARDPTGAKTLQKVLGKGLLQIDAQWSQWVQKQEPPWRPGYQLKAHLGVRMEPTPEGVRVTGFVRGTAAVKVAALKTNDVIISVAGQPTPTPGDLTRAVQSCQPGNVVEIEVVRDGRTVVLKHLLGLMPP